MHSPITLAAGMAASSHSDDDLPSLVYDVFSDERTMCVCVEVLILPAISSSSSVISFLALRSIYFRD